MCIGEFLGGLYVHNTLVQLFMPYWNFEYTKTVTYTVENMGGGIEVTHLGLNQPPVFFCFFFQCIYMYLRLSLCGGMEKVVNWWAYRKVGNGWKLEQKLDIETLEKQK